MSLVDWRCRCAGSRTNEYVLEVQVECDRGKGVCGGSCVLNSCVSNFEFFPLKRLNKRAIEIAGSHGGDSLVWYYRIDATGAWLSMGVL